MSESTPFNVLLTDFLPAALVESVDKEAVKVESVPPVRLLDDLRSPAAENTPAPKSDQPAPSVKKRSRGHHVHWPPILSRNSFILAKNPVDSGWVFCEDS